MNRAVETIDDAQPGVIIVLAQKGQKQFPHHKAAFISAIAISTRPRSARTRSDSAIV
jgi:hypothetical protein